ncbi:unnamed protein product [Blepharisma stoltei]|uniref:F-box domain-containing protein n=1 Tax=Blepharisma stoltei TaxID=1481888 RepID=A0AAU9JD36_9CILI|nr:unnamed protein product [Blepharisma stoltei]
MAKLDKLPLDLIRHHILPFMRKPESFIILGSINKRLRHKWNKLHFDIIQLAEKRIPELTKVISDSESIIQTDNTPNLSRNLFQAAVDIGSIHFMELDYEDEPTLILLGMILVFTRNLGSLPSQEEIIFHIKRPKPIHKLEHLNVRKISMRALQLVLYIMNEHIWQIIEEKFVGENQALVNWVKLFSKYMTEAAKFSELQTAYEYALVSKRGFLRLLKSSEKIWSDK